MGVPRLLAVLATAAWRPWIDGFLRPEPGAPIGPGITTGRPAAQAGRFDAAVFFSNHDSLRRDLRWSRELSVPCAVHPEAVVRLAYDKRAMARRARDVAGLHAIPDLTPGMAADLLARGLVPAIVAKRPDGTAGHGMRLFSRAADLAATGTRFYEGDYLLQPFIEGEEFSVNSAWFDGRVSFYPPVAKGPTSARIHPHLRTRRCPAPLAGDPAWRRVLRACEEYLRPFAPAGLVEFEFIRRRDEFLLLEINPRLSATLRLTAAAAERNPFLDLLAAVAGLRTLGGVVGARRPALEWATPDRLAPAVRAELVRRPDVWVSTRITVAAPDARALERRAGSIRALAGGVRKEARRSFLRGARKGW